MATFTATAAPAGTARTIAGLADGELVRRVRAGDDRAFEQLYGRYHRRIAAYVQSMVHDHARAEDITQDVFVSALRRMRDTQRPIAFKPWVYEIAKNACIDQFRRSRRSPEVSFDGDDEGALSGGDRVRMPAPAPTPELAVDQKQQLDHLRGAFGGLSETHHDILVMRELAGMSYREIGDRMGLTQPAVESTLFRARRRLSEEYEELATGQRCMRVQSIISTAATGAVGSRDRRRMARHVSECPSCRLHARLAGVDEALLAHTPIRKRSPASCRCPRSSSAAGWPTCSARRTRSTRSSCPRGARPPRRPRRSRSPGSARAPRRR
jgi:RNA polymerase sigma factor (sigma-70 family)